MFKEITIDEIPEDYVASKGNIKIMAIGKIRDFGEGVRMSDGCRGERVS